MSKQILELCALLVRHQYGEAPAVIFSTLLEHGRSRKVDFLRTVGLTPRYIKSGLATLLSHGLATHYPPNPPDATFYEADKRRAYGIVRSGRNIELAQQRLGREAAAVMIACQDLGIISETQLIKESRLFPDASHNHAHLNGTSSTTASTDESLDVWAKTVEQLHEQGFLERVHHASYMSDTDLNIAVGDWLQRHNKDFSKSISGPKKSVDFHNALVTKKFNVKKGIDALDDPYAIEQNTNSESAQDNPKKRRKLGKANGLEESQGHAGQQEYANTEKRPSKKRKTNKKGQHISEASHDHEPTISVDIDKLQAGEIAPENHQPHMEEHSSGKGVSHSVNHNLDTKFLRLSPERFALAYRSEALVQFATRKLGETTGRVLAALLKVLEDTFVQSLSHVDEYGEAKKVDLTASTDHVVRTLEPSLISALKNDSEARESHERREEGNQVNEDNEADQHHVSGGPNTKPLKEPVNGVVKHKAKTAFSGDRHLRQFVAHHLSMLAEDPQEFVHHDRHFDTWSVDHRELVRRLTQVELERTINARFGPTAARLVRILHEKGKLEEKQIGVFGLVQQKELRTALTSMQEAGYIEVQEIPKDNSRQPARTIYLWSYNQDHCRDVVLDRTYKTMSRLLQRYDLEKDAVSSVLEKSQRTDVQGHEDEFLSSMEKEALQNWRAKEEKIQRQLSRLDELVLLFKDFWDLDES